MGFSLCHLCFCLVCRHGSYGLHKGAHLGSNAHLDELSLFAPSCGNNPVAHVREGNVLLVGFVAHTNTIYVPVSFSLTFTSLQSKDVNEMH